jgi:hypothetical protein
MGTRSLTGGNAMSNKTPFMYVIPFGLALSPICFSTVSAQERCKVSEDAAAANTELWSRGYSDYIDRNGRTWRYDVTLLENGDKIFSQFDGTSQTTVAPDGSKKSTFTGVTRYIGGTGKYEGIRGFLRIHAVFEPDKNVNQLQTEGEYWLPASTVGQSQK